MGAEKTVEARLFGITAQASGTIRLPVGDSSGGTFTARINPLRGSLLWDRAMYVITNVSVAGGATGGSYVVTVESDAVSGYTGLPIARYSGLGPDSSSDASFIMDNLHNSPASVLPTHLKIFDAEGAGTPSTITLTVDVIAKQYRGVFGGPGVSERVVQGTILRAASYSGGQFVSGKGFDSDETITFGTSMSKMGLDRIRLWDTALFWTVSGESCAGAHECHVIATINGVTTEIAASATSAIGTTAGDAVPLANNFYGMCPTPSHIIWTEVSAGGISDARLVVVAKSGRGSMAKR